MKSLLIACLVMAGCGGEEYELVPVEQETVPTPATVTITRTVVQLPYINVSVPVDEPDAGRYPWIDCARHKKSQGHGRGLGRSCE